MQSEQIKATVLIEKSSSSEKIIIEKDGRVYLMCESRISNYRKIVDFFDDKYSFKSNLYVHSKDDTKKIIEFRFSTFDKIRNIFLIMNTKTDANILSKALSSNGISININTKTKERLEKFLTEAVRTSDIVNIPLHYGWNLSDNDKGEFEFIRPGEKMIWEDLLQKCFNK